MSIFAHFSERKGPVKRGFFSEVLAKEMRGSLANELAETLEKWEDKAQERAWSWLRQSEGMSLGGRNDAGIRLLFGAGCASLPAMMTNRSPADPRLRRLSLELSGPTSRAWERLGKVCGEEISFFAWRKSFPSFAGPAGENPPRPADSGVFGSSSRSHLPASRVAR
jgi:hypothetical protein